MFDIINEILEMPYHKNYSAVSGAVHNIAKHEDAIEDVFFNHKLSKTEMPKITIPTGKFFKVGPKKGLPKTRIMSRKEIRDRWLKDIDMEYIPDNSYISQPCGTHDSPDFIVKMKGKIYMLECKSAKGATPVFNSAYPKRNYIYAFTSEKYNATTVFLGQHVVPENAEKIYDEIHNAIKECIKPFLPKLKEADDNNRGLSFYPRDMYTLSGTKEKTDFFIHKSRSVAENEVREFVS